MRIFTIRHKPTGNYLLQRNRLRGGTKEEPQEWTDKRCARFFPNKSNAKKALTAWLSGKWKDEYYDTMDGPENGGPAPTLVPTRKKDEMEIVEFRLSEQHEKTHS